MQTEPASPRILVVEDNTQWVKNIEKILKRVGEERPFEHCDIDHFFARFSSSADFDNVFVCIVDLELSGDGNQFATDIQGLTEVLPWIRARAPWLPIACISRYLGEATMVAQVSASDFDFFGAKQIIGANDRTHPEFNAEKWKEMLYAMEAKRAAWLCGRTLQSLQAAAKKASELTVDEGTSAALRLHNVSQSDFAAALRVIGIEAPEIAVEQIQQGFSGLQVSRVRATGYVEQEASSSHWLLKWGRPLSKLCSESQAHRRMFLADIGRNLQIPPLTQNAISWKSVGYMAYAFERDSETALQFVKQRGVEQLEGAISKITTALYSNGRKRSVSVRANLNQWTGLSTQQLQAVPQMGLSEFADVTWSLIHGDLHLRNIFVRNGQPTLIDFARAAPGPIAIDAAKLFVDVLAFASPRASDWPVSLALSAIESTHAWKLLRPFFDAFRNVDDKAFLQLAIHAFISKYVDYDDVEVEMKQRLSALLSTPT
jgi:hypothetical protein